MKLKGTFCKKTSIVQKRLKLIFLLLFSRETGRYSFAEIKTEVQVHKTSNKTPRHQRIVRLLRRKKRSEPDPHSGMSQGDVRHNEGGGWGGRRQGVSLPTEKLLEKGATPLQPLPGRSSSQVAVCELTKWGGDYVYNFVSMGKLIKYVKYRRSTC